MQRDVKDLEGNVKEITMDDKKSRLGPGSGGGDHPDYYFSGSRTCWEKGARKGMGA